MRDHLSAEIAAVGNRALWKQAVRRAKLAEALLDAMASEIEEGFATRSYSNRLEVDPVVCRRLLVRYVKLCQQRRTREVANG